MIDPIPQRDSILDQLRSLNAQDARPIRVKAQEAQVSENTYKDLISGVQKNPQLTTLISCLIMLNAKLIIETKQSVAAVAYEDVEHYRKEIADAEEKNTFLSDALAIAKERIVHLEKDVERLAAVYREARADVARKDKRLGELVERISILTDHIIKEGR